MIFSNKVSHQIVYPALYLDRVKLKEVDEHKHLGLILSLCFVILKAPVERIAALL
jgi:hypothetical protein